MKKLISSLIIACALVTPTLVTAGDYGHSHNHFNPALEQLGNDIIGLTVCYKNGYLSDDEQEPAFTNLIRHADVSGEELGMFYMDKLGPKAEQIMGDDESRLLWDEDYCANLTNTYIDAEQLAHEKASSHRHSDSHYHAHEDSISHDHHNHGPLSAEIIQQDIERGRLLSIH